MKKIVIIAGPNGAGKTTFALEYLPTELECDIFVNADEIAKHLGSTTRTKVALLAGKRMLEEIKQHVQRGKNFAFESTLSGKNYAKLIPRWQQEGYEVKLIFLSLPKADMAVARVAARVAQGGHHIPESDVKRRFIRGWQNFNKVYKLLVDAWIHYDNSFSKPVLREKGKRE